MLICLIDTLRGLMITGEENVHGYAVDFAVMLDVFAALLFVAVGCTRRWRDEPQRCRGTPDDSCCKLGCTP
jgi:hypothetical protein